MAGKRKKIIKLFYALFVFCIVVLASSSLLNNKNFAKAGVEDTMSGWLWSEIAGWISLNSINCDILNQSSPVCTSPGIDYGVTVNTDSTITGEAWAENFGWICFGDTCDSWGTGNAPDGGIASSTFDGVKFLGWANVFSMGSEGWIKLQGPATSTLPFVKGEKPYLYCFNCVKKACQTCFTDTVASIYCLDDFFGGSVCYDCLDCKENGSFYACEECDYCNQYGLTVNSTSKEVFGWAWSGNENNKGIGWVLADDCLSSAYVPFSWLQVKYGNIYSQDEIMASSSPPARYNATYCIISGTSSANAIVNFKSAKDCELSDFENITFPEHENLYANVLGKIDKDGILNGHYGTVDVIPMINPMTKDLTKIIEDPETQGKTLDGMIYYFTDNIFTVNKELIFNNTFNSDGSGLIVIDGDLYIDENVTYENAAVSRMKDLASVGWIIKGNLYIHGDVTEIVGAFYVEGDDGIDGNVAVYTAYDDPVNNSGNQLKIYGMMIAPKYDFQRTYKSIDEGAEQIIYDGRALVNIPPGMEDLTKSLPLWSELAP